MHLLVVVFRLLLELPRRRESKMASIDHEFGDQHTELKLSIVEKYLKFFTLALRGKFEELWYIDAFAGTGSRTIRHEERPAGLLDAGEPERVERRLGSARIAIDVNPPFDFIVFIEQKPSYVVALEELAANFPDRRVIVVKNDANEGLKSLVAANSWRSTRAVLFIDPYGMEMEWSTLEKIAATKAIDGFCFLWRVSIGRPLGIWQTSISTSEVLLPECLVLMRGRPSCTQKQRAMICSMD